MSNVLSEEKKQQVIGLGRLGWTLRRIESATGVRRETAASYLRAAGIAVRPPGHWGRSEAKPAKEASTDPGAVDGPSTAKAANEASTGCSVSASACEPYREFIETSLAKGRNAMAIWQDLVDQYGFANRYASVRRFVGKLRGESPSEACALIATAPAEEAQVDYGSGPMVRDPNTAKYRRTRLFVLTLAYSRKAVRFLTFRSSTSVWAQLHEQAFGRLGGAPRVLVLDNLREGVLAPDIYDPALNPVYSDMLAHYGITALPCRVRHPNRKALNSYCTS